MINPETKRKREKAYYEKHREKLLPKNRAHGKKKYNEDVEYRETLLSRRRKKYATDPNPAPRKKLGDTSSSRVTTYPKRTMTRYSQNKKGFVQFAKVAEASDLCP